MVELEHWGELQELLENSSLDFLKELCYILGLRRSGTKAELIDEIKNSEFTYEFIINIYNFLSFGFAILFEHFSSSELSDIIRKFDLARQRRNWDKTVEIIKSGEVTPRMILGQLTPEVLEQVYVDLYETEPTSDRDGIIRQIIANFELDWLDEIMDKGLILMPITTDFDLENTYQIIKEECKKVDINAIRIDEVVSSGKVDEEVLEHIDESEYILVDLTLERPNVYYELGYVHGIGKKLEKIILIAKKDTPLHFDIRNMRTIFYKDHKDLRKKLGKRLKATKNR